MSPETANRLFQLYLARGVLASAAIEGNSLSEADALKLVQGKALELPPSREYLEREVENLLRLINEIAADAMSGRRSQLTVARLKEYNRRILDGVEVEDHVVPGEVPTIGIGVGRYRGAPRPDCEHLLERLCDWLNQDWAKGISPIQAALIKAVVAHLYFVWIHPFGDGNGRTARMIEAQILLQSGIPQPACQLLTNHYCKTRDRYYRELDRASASGGDVVPFLIYAIEGFRDCLKEQIDVVRQQQWEVSWKDYIYRSLPDDGANDLRKRRLILDLSKQSQPVPKSEITQLSAQVALAYAKVDDKTLARDLVWLENKKLIRREGDSYVANRELILAFLPARARADVRVILRASAGTRRTLPRGTPHVR